MGFHWLESYTGQLLLWPEILLTILNMRISSEKMESFRCVTVFSITTILSSGKPKTIQLLFGTMELTTIKQLFLQTTCHRGPIRELTNSETYTRQSLQIVEQIHLIISRTGLHCLSILETIKSIRRTHGRTPHATTVPVPRVADSKTADKKCSKTSRKKLNSTADEIKLPSILQCVFSDLFFASYPKRSSLGPAVKVFPLNLKTQIFAHTTRSVVPYCRIVQPVGVDKVVSYD